MFTLSPATSHAIPHPVQRSSFLCTETTESSAFLTSTLLCSAGSRRMINQVWKLLPVFSNDQFQNGLLPFSPIAYVFVKKSKSPSPRRVLVCVRQKSGGSLKTSDIADDFDAFEILNGLEDLNDTHGMHIVCSILSTFESAAYDRQGPKDRTRSIIAIGKRGAMAPALQTYDTQ